MSQDTRILNISRNTRLKPHQAERRIAEGLAVWVNPGESIRDANLKEVLEHRAVMASAEATGHPDVDEIRGLRYLPPDSPTWQLQHAEAQRSIAREAMRYSRVRVDRTPRELSCKGFMPEHLRYEKYAKWCQDNKYPVAPIEVWRSMSSKIAETNYSWPTK